MAIRLRGIVKSFGVPATPVLKSIDLDVEDGEFTTLTGRSGSGKSTLLYVMSSLDRPTAGTVEIDRRLLESMRSPELHALRNRTIGFVFQFHYLLPELTALENVLVPARKAGEDKALRGRAMELLEQFELGDKAWRLPGQLSGGEQQRVAIAHALVMRPRYLFADEPTGHLDSASGDRVMGIFERVNREEGMTVVYVTHDAGYAALARRQVRLVDGQLL